MAITLVDAQGATRDLDVLPGESLLQVLQRAGAAVEAPCGGNGTCGKCEVAVRTSTGLARVLACRTQPAPGMIVYQADAADVVVEAESSASAFDGPLDAAASGDTGVSVDLGTTTIACYLYDLFSGRLLARAGAANPQSMFGADVISRIMACSEGNLPELQQLAASRIGSLIDRMCGEAGIDRQRVCRWTLVGNTTMEHIVCGLSPEGIGVSPFTPASLFGDVRAMDGVAPEAFIGPCVSGYVGADAVAGVLACGMDCTDRAVLLADLGTNGELVLAADGKLYCCATATGPAFEGANIVMGMQARPGAIDSCAMDADGAFRITTVGGAPAIGICGSGLIDALAACLQAGLVDETGRIVDEDEVPAESVALLGTFENDRAIKLVPDGSVVLAQRDVRALQLAKAAVCAGMRVLLNRAGCALADVDQLAIGGAFGAHLNAESAADVGIFPAELLPAVKMVGNCAGAGASQMLLSREARDRASAAARRMEYIELSCDGDFSAAYVDEMMFGDDR